MAKTESTAVNELIALVQNNKQPSAEPAADLFASPAPTAARVNPPRMTSPVPPMRGAGEVEPLPRGRAPHSTAELAMSPHVRMTTADPERGNTIPPLSQLTPRTTAAAPPIPPRAMTSVPAIPPPRKTPRATGAQRISTQAPAQRPPSQPPVPPHQRAASQPPVPPHQRASTQPLVTPHERAASQPPVPPHARASSPDVMRPSQMETLRPGSMPTLPVPRASSGSLPTRPVERVSTPIATRSATQMPIAAPPLALDPVAAMDIDQTPLPPPYTELSPLPGPLPIQSRPTVPSSAALPLPRPVPQQDPIVASASGSVTDWRAPVPKPRKSERSEGTAIVVRHHDHRALVKKLIAPAIIAVLVGAAVGAYFAFEGKGGKPEPVTAAAGTAEESSRVAMPVVGREPPAVEADTAGTVAQPEPPTKAEQLASVAAASAAEANESMIPAATSVAVSGSATAPAANAPASATPTATAAAPTPASAAPAVTAAAPTSTPPAPTSPATTTTTSPANVREVRTLRGIVKLVDVRIDSKPAGAEVMLVDNGKTSFLGSTPLATSLDASRTYDLIFTLPGRPTKMAALDPSKTTKIDVRIHRGSSARKDPATDAVALGSDFFDPPAEKKPAARTEKVVDRTAAKTAEKAGDTTEKAAAAPAKTDKKDAVGEGTLMVSSKPPCEIIIDGKPTGLTTPQRSIPLPAGPHKITFVNAAEGINKTVSVTIVADQATKLIQDLMNK